MPSYEELERNPVWYEGDCGEDWKPAPIYSPLPDNLGLLLARAQFLLANGVRVPGYIIDIPPYAFGLFIGGCEYLLNLNLEQLASQTLDDIAREHGPAYSSIFPVKYWLDFECGEELKGILNSFT